MHASVKEIRAILAGIEGVFVRRWRDGEIWAGIDERKGSLSDLDEIKARIKASDKYRTTVRATRRSWLVEAA